MHQKSLFRPVNRALSYGVALFALCAGAVTLHGQSFYGSIRGNVVDPNGGAIATAKVTLTNEGTSGQRATVSSSSGEFVFSEVVPATYSVTVEAPGFKKFERHGIILGTQQQVSLDLKLDV